MSAAVKWYTKGFALGAAGALPTRRKGRPRLRAMVPHWKKGIVDGAFCRQAMSHAYGVALNGPDPRLARLMSRG